MFWCYSLLVKLHKIGEVLHFHLLGKKDFRVKAKNEKFVWQTRSVNYTKECAARTVRSFLCTEAIKSLVFGVAFAVVVTTATATRTTEIFLFNEKNKIKNPGILARTAHLSRAFSRSFSHFDTFLRSKTTTCGGH